ncbi:DUF2442 domain-containing protein [Halomonas sp. JB37]|uniref:DUF2442 domain-containing protein n=1 Tax=Halomonas sp. JB37 TaxID=2024405 RepID=UPI000BB9B913|nr:DUF2442 domain-containing protein [Halomonas sp. JB37]PCC20594.1 hypothetical protein CIK78_17680 [Halomonas sp. JB37]
MLTLTLESEPRAVEVGFTADAFCVTLEDGRTLSVPLAWFPRLLNATAEQLADYELSARGIHWGALDEDISVEGLLAGRGDRTRRRNPVV